MKNSNASLASYIYSQFDKTEKKLSGGKLYLITQRESGGTNVLTSGARQIKRMLKRIKKRKNLYVVEFMNDQRAIPVNLIDIEWFENHQVEQKQPKTMTCVSKYENYDYNERHNRCEINDY